MSVHVVPVRDAIAHRLDGVGSCPCAPRLEFFDPKGEAYEHGPLVVHERVGAPSTAPTKEAWRVVDTDAERESADS